MDEWKGTYGCCTASGAASKAGVVWGERRPLLGDAVYPKWAKTPGVDLAYRGFWAVGDSRSLAVRPPPPQSPWLLSGKTLWHGGPSMLVSISRL